MEDRSLPLSPGIFAHTPPAAGTHGQGHTPGLVFPSHALPLKSSLLMPSLTRLSAFASLFPFWKLLLLTQLLYLLCSISKTSGSSSPSSPAPSPGSCSHPPSAPRILVPASPHSSKAPTHVTCLHTLERLLLTTVFFLPFLICMSR